MLIIESKEQIVSLSYQLSNISRFDHNKGTQYLVYSIFYLMDGNNNNNINNNNNKAV